MGRYYEIIPVVTRTTTMFDTIQTVANVSGRSYLDIIHMMGFDTSAGLLAYCNQNTTPHFNKTAFVTRVLNDICRELDLSLRVIRPQMNLRKEQ